MRVYYDANRQVFALHTACSTYAFAVNQTGRLVHLYWGGLLDTPDAFDTLLSGINEQDAFGVHQSKLNRQEYRVQEPFDFGEPALLCRFPDGVRSVRLVYVSHDIVDDSLTITLRDEVYPLCIQLIYKGYGSLDLISRHSILRNEGHAPITLFETLSATYHLPAGERYRLTYMAGSWGAEYQKQHIPVTQTKIVLENRRGTCGAHQQVPFFALDPRGQSTEITGEVFYGVLHWSGNFKIAIEQNNLGQLSIAGGINDFDTEYNMQAGTSFQTPRFTVGYSASGFEQMTKTLYDWQFDHLCPREKAHAQRPILYNSWYPYEFDVREDNMLALIGRAAEIGVELFVIDDGWMPKRVSDRAGLGDWTVDTARFPHGLLPIAQACHARDMQFGLWVEPEMVNPDSDLYRAHPDWVLCDETRPHTECRHQLILNLARDDVRDWAISWLDQIIDAYQLDYLKWDMNRYFTEYGWADVPMDDKRSVNIKYIQNLYAIWHHLHVQHPHVLFENCASGGGRTDFGMAPYADRINRSDNADPVDVMLLHEGFTMLFLPKMAGGAGNIAASPNGINGRTTPLSFRIHTGMTGSMSIGINLLTAPSEDLTTLKQAIAYFKSVRGDLQDAYVYRIASAWEHPYSILQYVRRDKGAFSVFAFANGMHHWDKVLPTFRMRGLDPNAVYLREDGVRFRGDVLMRLGIQIELRGDYNSVFMHFCKDA